MYYICSIGVCHAALGKQFQESCLLFPTNTMTIFAERKRIETVTSLCMLHAFNTFWIFSAAFPHSAGEAPKQFQFLETLLNRFGGARVPNARLFFTFGGKLEVNFFTTFMFLQFAGSLNPGLSMCINWLVTWFFLLGAHTWRRAFQNCYTYALMFILVCH